MNDIVIRRAEPSDAEGVALTFRARQASMGTLQNPYPSIAQWTERLARNSTLNYVLVALAGEEVVGHAGLHGNENPRRAHAWFLGMSVRDDWHNRRVGTRLMESLIDLADNWLGALRIELTVYVSNEHALKLYRKFGFEVEGTHRAYSLRDGQYTDTYAMARLHPRPPRLPPSGVSG
ncbi:MAG: GNAT family N-acetyltransferase [Burkholderiaceae bacterium]